jgi:hypothetical protein
MSDLSYMIWFLATAVMTITVLTVATLASAGMLYERQRERRRSGPRSGAPLRVAPSEISAAAVVNGTGRTPTHERRAA